MFTFVYSYLSILREIVVVLSLTCSLTCSFVIRVSFMCSFAYSCGLPVFCVSVSIYVFVCATVYVAFFAFIGFLVSLRMRVRLRLRFRPCVHIRQSSVFGTCCFSRCVLVLVCGFAWLSSTCSCVYVLVRVLFKVCGFVRVVIPVHVCALFP